MMQQSSLRGCVGFFFISWGPDDTGKFKCEVDRKEMHKGDNTCDGSLLFPPSRVTPYPPPPPLLASPVIFGRCCVPGDHA